MSGTEVIGGVGVALLFLLMGITIRRNNKRRSAEIDEELKELMREARRHDE